MPEKRNLTTEAKEILELLSCLERQKNGRGVTLLHLSELWRGTKTKAHTKFIKLDQLVGYAAGAKYSKSQVDSIAHSLVFENVLEEIPETTGSGFQADYARPGPKSQAVLANSFQFYVRFAAKKAPEPKATSKKKAAKGKNGNASEMSSAVGDGDSEKPKARRKSNSKAKKSEKAARSPADLGDSPETDERIGAKRKNEQTTLPKKHMDELLARIKKLVNMWAEEVSDADILIEIIWFHLFYCSSSSSSDRSTPRCVLF